ncbi:MAG TPA: dihydrofolate reductase family protein [Chitinophagaceae bacterium]|nr:dihydrofolate reductase family protein [Chitinophagaceae bacterium]
MRKLIVSMMVSLDGYTEDSRKELGWHVWNNEMDDYMMEFFRHIDGIVLGRVSYELMADYWPGVQTENAGITHKMNSLPKYVFSHSLVKAEWNNTRLLGGPLEEEILKLKKDEGRDLVFFGGNTVLSALHRQGLIDEYRLIINPLVLGNGNPLFRDKNDKKKLELIYTKSFQCGNVLLCYRARENES